MSAALLLLADGRLPAGGDAHSGGIEAAVERGLVHDVASLELFLRGRLETTGLTAAVLAASACAATDLVTLDAVADARTPSPAQRATSRAQGRALLRLARSAWPSPLLAELGPEPHHAVAVGVIARIAGISPLEAALTAAVASVSGPASAAVRLLGLDPVAVTAVQARLSPQADAIAREAVEHPERCPGSPVLDLLAEAHAARDVPLFAS